MICNVNSRAPSDSKNLRGRAEAGLPAACLRTAILEVLLFGRPAASTLCALEYS